MLQPASDGSAGFTAISRITPWSLASSWRLTEEWIGAPSPQLTVTAAIQNRSAAAPLVSPKTRAKLRETGTAKPMDRSRLSPMSHPHTSKRRQPGERPGAGLYPGEIAFGRYLGLLGLSGDQRRHRASSAGPANRPVAMVMNHAIPPSPSAAPPSP